MLPRPAQSDAPNPVYDWQRSSALNDFVRRVLFEPLATYRNAMWPRQARWDTISRSAEANYTREVTVSLRLRDRIRYKAYDCHLGHRLPGSACCDFMQQRLQGIPTDTVLRELRRRERMHAASATPRTVAYFMGADALMRLYATRGLRMLNHLRREQGWAKTCALPAPNLERICGLRVPISFHDAATLHLSGDPRPTTRLRYARHLEGLAALLADRKRSNPLVMLWLDREEGEGSHVLVCDLSSDNPGVFDPWYGFLCADGPSDQDMVALLAELACRYSARSLVALQDEAGPQP